MLESPLEVEVKKSPKLPSPPDLMLLLLVMFFRYREGGPASYWIHHWVIFLDKSFTMIAVTVPLSNGRSRIDYIYFMEQVLLAPKTGQSKAILSRRFALFISFNWTLQLQWDQDFITIWNTKMKICLSYRLLKKNWAGRI